MEATVRLSQEPRGFMYFILFLFSNLPLRALDAPTRPTQIFPRPKWQHSILFHSIRHSFLLQRLPKYIVGRLSTGCGRVLVLGDKWILDVSTFISNIVIVY